MHSCGMAESEATKSLADLIMDSLRSVEHDFWEDLLRNVVVAGAGPPLSALRHS